MRHILILLFLGLSLSQTSCLIKPVDEEPDPWTNALNFSTNTPIRNLHAGEVEFLAITDDEFIRLNNQGDVIEKRDLSLPFRFFGRPTLSDRIFTRVTRQGQTDQTIEFHLTSVNNEILNYTFEQLETDTGDQLFPETSGRYTSAFNDEGTQYLIAAQNFTKDIYTLLLFDIQLNNTNSAFNQVSLARHIDIPDLQNDPNSISNTKFVNGNYYVTSLNGAFRLTPQGDVTKVFDEWMLDFFAFNDTIFVTSSAAKLLFSTDDGLSWEEWRDNERTELQYVEVANGELYSQPFVGFPFQKADDDFLKSKKVRLNTDFSEDISAYNNIRYFFGKYYMARQKELYFTENLLTE